MRYQLRQSSVSFVIIARGFGIVKRYFSVFFLRFLRFTPCFWALVHENGEKYGGKRTAPIAKLSAILYTCNRKLPLSPKRIT